MWVSAVNPGAVLTSQKDARVSNAPECRWREAMCSGWPGWWLKGDLGTEALPSRVERWGREEGVPL